jgi:hypothetical protein
MIAPDMSKQLSPFTHGNVEDETGRGPQMSAFMQNE